MSRRRTVTVWAVAFTVTVVAFAVLRWGLIELFTALNELSFRSRPEVENWAIPSYGVDVPATWLAASIAVLGLAAFGLALRGKRSGRRTASSGGPNGG